MDLAQWWRERPPRYRRGLVIGASLAGLALLLYPFVRTDEPTSRHGRDQVIKQILTDKDPRTLGFDAVLVELKSLREQLEATKRQTPPANQTTTLQSELQKLQENLQSTTNELRELREQVRRPPEAAGAARLEPPVAGAARSEPPAAGAARSEPPAAGAARSESAAAPPRLPPAGKPSPDRAVPTLPNTLFAPPGTPAGSALAPTGLPGGLAPAGTAPPVAPGGRTAPKIRVLTEGTVEEGGSTTARPAGAAAAGTVRAGATPGKTGKPGIYLPTSILSGTLLTGLDAPTGQGARADPIPALLRVKHEALGPNFASVDIRECFLIAAGHGDLSSERAYLRAETLSCVRQDGGVIEAPVEAYAVGEDGKAGIGGRLVSKQGQVLARALQAGFLEAFAQMFQKQPVATIATSASSKTPYQSNLTPDALQSAALAGVGNALDRLAQFYVDMAQGMFPVIEISAGRPIDFVVIRGRELQLQTRAGR